ncbi:hypothetical protein phiOC_p227 [Ochrobactrum phage vB_OspM_OC]|nr:hypothetical protein phiOC_p227 [Ochrobactrum phage vB_OspM_OC]
MGKLKGIRDEYGNLKLPKKDQELENVRDFDDGYTLEAVQEIFKMFSVNHNIPIENIRLIPFSRYDEKYEETDHWISMVGIDEETDEEMRSRLIKENAEAVAIEKLEADKLANERQEYERLKAKFETK